MLDRRLSASTRAVVGAMASVPRVQIVLYWLGLLALGFAAIVAGQVAMAQDEAQEPEKTITTYAFSDMGDVKYPADFAHLDYVNPDAPRGGEMSTWARGTFDSMNPYSRKGRAHAYSTMPYESIMTSTADDAYSAYCLLCESLEYPESQNWVIFNLRPEVTFSDGTPLTAEDLAYTFRLQVEQGLPSFAAAVKNLIPEVEVLGPHRIKFHFNPEVPRKGLISQAGATPAMQKKWFEETGARLDESRLTQPPGTGPYMIDEVEVNRRITLKRNPDYWGDDLPINIGQNNFDKLRVEFFSDTNAALEGFKAGAYTFRVESSSLTWATQYDFPKANDGTIIKTELPDGSLPVATGMVFNLRKDKFSDVRVREALGLMFNFTWTNDTLQYGLFDQRESFWQNSDLEAKSVPEGRELAYLEMVSEDLDPAILTEPARVAHTSGARQLDRDNLDKASALMREAGWVQASPPPLPPRLGPVLAGGLALIVLLGAIGVGYRSRRRVLGIGLSVAGLVAAGAIFSTLGMPQTQAPDGKLRKDGKVFSVELLESNPSFDRIFLPYIDNLKRLGVDAKYNRVDDAQYTSRNRDGDFDMIYDYYRNGLEEGLGISQRYGCDDAENSVFNPAAYCNPAVDTLIDAVVDAESLEDMQAAVRAIDRILRHDYLMIPTWYKPTHWVAYYDMYEHPDNLPPYALGQESFWWLNAEKAEALQASGAF